MRVDAHGIRPSCDCFCRRLCGRESRSVQGAATTGRTSCGGASPRCDPTADSPSMAAGSRREGENDSAIVEPAERSCPAVDHHHPEATGANDQHIHLIKLNISNRPAAFSPQIHPHRTTHYVPTNHLTAKLPYPSVSMSPDLPAAGGSTTGRRETTVKRKVSARAGGQ